MEYCPDEGFSVFCAPGMTIMVTSAFYGRMQLGRCVRKDYGHLGCHADVTDILNSRCSRKQSCNISLPDNELEATIICASDLVKYLAANYSCEPSADAPTRAPDSVIEPQDEASSALKGNYIVGYCVWCLCFSVPCIIHFVTHYLI